MLLEMHPRLRIVVAFIPAMVVLATLVAAAVTDLWGALTIGIVIGLGWFAIWAPVEAIKPSRRVLMGLGLAALALVIAGIAVFLLY